MRRIDGMRACAVAGAAAWYLDERGSLRSWRRASHSFVLPPMRESLHAPAKLDLALRVKVRPPPIGCADWPAGRALLEVALRDIPRSGAKVLELGAGVGVTALGLAKASTCAAVISNARPTEIVATDVCEASLANLRENATSNGVAVTCVHGTTRDHAAACHSTAVLSTGVWDAAGGKAAVERLKSLGVDPLELTHVLGSDVMYHGFDDAASVGRPLMLARVLRDERHFFSDFRVQMESNAGLASTLAALLEANPRLQITLLLVDRFSGGAVAAVSQVVSFIPFTQPPILLAPGVKQGGASSWLWLRY